MRAETAMVKNVKALFDVAGDLKSRPMNLPGIAVVWGATGYGKTTATAKVVGETPAIYVRANACWTPRSMLGEIAEKLGGSVFPTASSTLTWVQTQLQERPRAVFVDEGDYLTANRKLVEVLRDLHDLSRAPLVLIGMADFKAKVTHHAQLAGRVSRWVEFAPADLEDVAKITSATCEVELEDELLERLRAETFGSVRGVVVGLERVETFAKKAKLKKVSSEDWGNRSFTLGGGRKAGV